MAATTFPPALGLPRRSLQRSLAVYAKEAKYELLKNVRIPVYAISTVAFPLMFYVLFGIVLGRSEPGSTERATYALATMGCFGVMAVALFGFGVSLAMERGQGWLQLKRASPMPVSAYFAGKLFSAVVFSTVIMLMLLTVGITVWWSPSADRYRCQAGRHSGGRFDSVLRHGAGDWLFRQAKLGARCGQPDLLTNVVLLGIVDSAVSAAARTARTGDVPAAVSPVPVSLERRGAGPEPHSGMGPRGSADSFHPGQPGRGGVGLSPG